MKQLNPMATRLRQFKATQVSSTLKARRLSFRGG
jgi:hypothetical protein